MFIAGLTLSRSPFPLRRHHSEQLFAAEGKRVCRSLPNSVQRYCWPPPRVRFNIQQASMGNTGSVRAIHDSYFRFYVFDSRVYIRKPCMYTFARP